MKQVISCFLSKEFSFSCFFIKKKFKEQTAEKNRSSHQSSSVKTAVLTNFAVFLGKHLC